MKKIENLKIGKYVLKIDTYTTTIVEYYGENIEIDLFKGFKKFKNSKDILNFQSYMGNYGIGILRWNNINYGDYHINMNKDDLTINFEIFNNRELRIKYDDTFDLE
jgi:hypothetical protein